MFDWLTKKNSIHLQADIHSHLIPGLDDGVKSFDESLHILRFFESNGYKKVITTPHIRPDMFHNTESDILAKLDALQQNLSREKLNIKLDAAAEYFICKELLEKINNSERLLSFGKKYLLIETSFYAKPLIFDEVIFSLKSNNYIPVLAHPERYQYLSDDFVWLKEIREKGVKMQVTLSSLVGMYGALPKKHAEKMLKNEMVDFLGSDIHNPNQLKALSRALQKKIKPQKLLNDELV